MKESFYIPAKYGHDPKVDKPLLSPSDLRMHELASDPAWGMDSTSCDEHVSWAEGHMIKEDVLFLDSSWALGFLTQVSLHLI